MSQAIDSPVIAFTILHLSLVPHARINRLLYLESQCLELVKQV